MMRIHQMILWGGFLLFLLLLGCEELPLNIDLSGRLGCRHHLDSLPFENVVSHRSLLRLGNG